MSIWTNRAWKPMLLKEIDTPFNSKDYLYEMKFDGIRAIIYVNKKEVKIISRNKNDVTNLYPELQNLKNIVSKNTIFDGEIVIMDKNRPSFSKLQERSHLKDNNKILKESINNPVIFVAFDILYLNKDLTNYPLIERKKILDNFNDNDYFVKTLYIIEKGNYLYNKMQEASLEGIVAKKIDSVYKKDVRSFAWIKIKCWQQNDFYVGGYKKNKKSDSISLYLGEYKDKKLIFVGKVSLYRKNRLYDEIVNKKKTKSYFSTLFKDKLNYIKPDIKCNIKYLERTKNNHLRQPIFNYY